MFPTSSRVPSCTIVLSLLAGTLCGCGGSSSSTGGNHLTPHAIAVRTGSSGLAEFYDRTTGATFTPRGNNYIRLAQQTNTDGTPTYTHSTFNVGLYDPNRAETALATMQSNGYNTVRVFLNGCCPYSLFDPSGGLSQAYMANIADFLGRAANHGMYLIIVGTGWLPAQGGYDPANCDQFAFNNTLDLCPGGVSATARFFHDFVLSLGNQNARTDAILGYELRNEYVYDLDQPPLSWTSGTVATADGKTYDMSSATSRQQMMDNGLIYFTDQVRSAIQALDPTALVDVGFFDTGQGNANSTQVYPAIANSTADFVDIHAGLPAPSLAQVAQDIGFVGYQQQKPILMGEYTANESDYPLISDAAAALQNWQIQSCTYSFKGWLLWAWDTEEAEQQPLNSPPYWWSAVSGDGSINTALAPAMRPDPCQ